MSIRNCNSNDSSQQSAQTGHESRALFAELDLFIYFIFFLKKELDLLLFRVSCSLRSNHQVTAKTNGYLRKYTQFKNTEEWLVA